VHSSITRHDALDGATSLDAHPIGDDLTAPLATNGNGSPRQRLLDIVDRFSRARILVVGDMVADEYLVGTPSRISREAPVIVLEHREQFTVPGGATNPGVNARALGAEVFLAGVVGDDIPGRELRRVLSEWMVHQDGLVSEAGRPTSTKTRILAGSAQIVQQQIVRVDRVDHSFLGPDCERSIIAYLRHTTPDVDALLISDYENGVITPAIVDCCLRLAREHGKIVVVDSHGDLGRFKGATALTPNEPEAAGSLGVQIADPSGLEEAGRRLLDLTQTSGVLITRGSEGMSLFERDKPPLHLPAVLTRAVVDTTGAGDTVSATFTLALVAGASMAEAAALSTIAAGLVVRRLGCATTSPAELRASIDQLVRA
jgi:D-glycero-beta-D-manno-heptose-7-phosphate kinase